MSEQIGKSDIDGNSVNLATPSDHELKQQGLHIPPKSNRCYKTGLLARALYRDRNAVERMFGRLKDFRRIGTRYERRADVYLSAIYLAATVTDRS